MTPRSYSAKGKSSRFSDMDDELTVDGNNVFISRRGKKQTQTATRPWFVTDGYSPASMQEQMMRWWLTHGKPATFHVYPSISEVHIQSAETLNVGGLAAHGYTVGGLIWGEESLWIDDAQNLIALVSTDAEFDHFEAVRQPHEANLGVFIAAAVKANLARIDQADRDSEGGARAQACHYGRDAGGFDRRRARKGRRHCHREWHHYSSGPTSPGPDPETRDRS
jgi:hypothetical protein